MINKMVFNKNFRNFKGQDYQQAFVEYVARTFFKVWWINGNEHHKTNPTENDFKNFMGLWTTAQKSGLQEDWEKVQFKIVANDMATPGYRVNTTTIWPMYSGQTPDGTRAVKEFHIAYVYGLTNKNVAIVQKDWFAGAGNNLSHKTLNVYIAPGYNTPLPPNNAYDFANITSVVQDSLTKNNVYTSIDGELSKLLVNGKGRNAVGIVTFEP